MSCVVPGYFEASNELVEAEMWDSYELPCVDRPEYGLALRHYAEQHECTPAASRSELSEDAKVGLVAAESQLVAHIGASLDVV